MQKSPEKENKYYSGYGSIFWSHYHSKCNLFHNQTLLDNGQRYFFLQQTSIWVSESELFCAISPLNRFEAYRLLEVVRRHWFQQGMFATLYSAGVKLRGGKKLLFLCILKGRTLNALVQTTCNCKKRVLKLKIQDIKLLWINVFSLESVTAQGFREAEVLVLLCSIIVFQFFSIYG